MSPDESAGGERNIACPVRHNVDQVIRTRPNIEEPAQMIDAKIVGL
jgi:hypothetical protein